MVLTKTSKMRSSFGFGAPAIAHTLLARLRGDPRCQIRRLGPYRKASRYLSNRSIRHGILLVVAYLFAHALAEKLPVTGDESRYIYYAVSLLHTGRFTSRWYFGLPWPTFGPEPPWNPPFISAVASPFIALFGLDAPRILAALATAIGVFSLHRLLTTRFSLFTSDAVSILAAFGIPLFAYGQIFLTEGFAFSVLSVAWLMSRHTPTVKRLVYCTILISILPFIHIRSALAGVVIGLLLVLHVFQSTKTSRQLRNGVFLVGAIALLMFAAFAVYQFLIYGGLFGGFGARPSDLSNELPDRLAQIPMQFLYTRHGLLVYTPMFILGLSGLLAALIARKARGDWEGALLFVAAIAPLMWSGAGECPAGRFFVLSVPSLAFGIAYWLEYARRGPWKWFLVFTLGGLQVVTAISSLLRPMWFLANRSGPMPYDQLYRISGIFNFGYLFSVGMVNHRVQVWLFYAAMVMALAGALGCMRNRKISRWSLIVGVVFVIAFLDLSRMHDAPAHLIHIDANGPTTSVTIPHVRNIAQLRIAGLYIVGDGLGSTHPLQVESDHGEMKTVYMLPIVPIFPLFKDCGIRLQYPTKFFHSANPFAAMVSDSLLLRSFKTIETHLAHLTCN